MNNNDKNSILIVIYIVAFIALTFTFYNTTKFINPFWAGVLMVLIEMFYLYPKVVKNYWNVFPSEIGTRRFIPIYNELCLFDSKKAMITLILWVLMFIVASLFIMPVTWLSTVVGDVAALDLPYMLLRIFLLLLVTNCIFRGYLLLGVYKEIKEWHKELYGYRKAIKLFDIVAIISLFLPFFKSIGLFRMNSFLEILVNNNFTLEEAEDEYEES